MLNMFKPEAQKRVAQKMGYMNEDLTGFADYLKSNPEKMQQFDGYKQQAIRMARGGLARRYAEGGAVYPQLPQQQPTAQAYTPGQNINDLSAEMVTQPGLPTGGQIYTVGTGQDPAQQLQAGTGQLEGQVGVPTALATTYQADSPTTQQANITTASTASAGVDNALQATQAAQSSGDPRAEVIAAQQTASSVSDVEAAQGQHTILNNPMQRQIQSGELIDGVANAEKAAQFTSEVEAAQATPSDKATVQGQLDSLMADFDGSEPPAWAAGALRNASAQMAKRGLGASTMAGQALVQAAMEASLPIAMADAQTNASFEMANLSNRQQRTMLAAQQRAAFLGQEFDQAFQARVANASRIADVANQNFTAEQQIALENSRAANTMNLANLSNSQATVMAEAAALANMDSQNLSNRQQTAVQNANNFLQTDLANLSNSQQTEMFKGQSRIQSLFTDQAAENAARQFNATSENQVEQFYQGLKTSVSQFNATQANAQAQFNTGQANVLERFNAEIDNQRDQFNAQNQLIIAQSNAQWRRQVATADTAAINRANELNALATLEISNQAYDNLWQQYRDVVEYAWRSAESELDRDATLANAKVQANSNQSIAREQADADSGSAVGGLIGTLGAALIGGIFG